MNIDHATAHPMVGLAMHPIAQAWSQPHRRTLPAHPRVIDWRASKRWIWI
jgi:hypothetical protein